MRSRRGSGGVREPFPWVVGVRNQRVVCSLSGRDSGPAGCPAPVLCSSRRRREFKSNLDQQHKPPPSCLFHKASGQRCDKKAPTRPTPGWSSEWGTPRPSTQSLKAFTWTWMVSECRGVAFPQFDIVPAARVPCQLPRIRSNYARGHVQRHSKKAAAAQDHNSNSVEEASDAAGQVR